jgi:hypothetical protein
MTQIADSRPIPRHAPGHALQRLIGLRGAPGASRLRLRGGGLATGGGLRGLGAAAAADAVPGDVAGTKNTMGIMGTLW